MLYIIGGIILFLLFAIFGGETGIGCFFFLVISLILWRIGVLGFIIRLIFKIIRWILVRLVYYYGKFFGEEENTAYLLGKVICLFI